MKKTNIRDLITNRLELQTNKRALESYGVIYPTLPYVLSNVFFNNTYLKMSELQKRQLLNILAGPIPENWAAARELIESGRILPD